MNILKKDHQQNEVKPNTNQGEKKPYVRPELREFGLINDFTQAITATMGADGGVAPSNRVMNCISVPPLIQEHRWLLQDTKVQEQFRAAILKKVKPGDVVLDLGTGTGLHAFFAVQAGASKVYAVDSELVIKAAQELALKNNMSDRIEFIMSHSEILQLPEKVDVIITNIGFLSTMKSLPAIVEKFLKPEGLLIPEKIQLGCTLVEDEKFYQEHVSFWSNSAWDLQLSAMKPFATSRPFYGNWDLKNIIGPMKELEPFNLSVSLDRTYEWQKNFKILRSGIVHGILGWYTFTLSDEHSFTTRPPLQLSPHIWSQWFFPLETPILVIADEEVNLKLGLSLNKNIEEPVWRWTIESKNKKTTQTSFDSLLLSKEKLPSRTTASN